MNTDSADRHPVPGLARGRQLLACYTRQGPPPAGAELSRHLGGPRAWVLRLLQTLEQINRLKARHIMFDAWTRTAEVPARAQARAVSAAPVRGEAGMKSGGLFPARSAGPILKQEVA